MAAEGRLYGQGVKGWPCMSLCLSIQKNTGETKTVSRSDQRVLPVQQVCTEGEKTEETLTVYFYILLQVENTMSH